MFDLPICASRAPGIGGHRGHLCSECEDGLVRLYSGRCCNPDKPFSTVRLVSYIVLYPAMGLVVLHGAGSVRTRESAGNVAIVTFFIQTLQLVGHELQFLQGVPFAREVVSALVSVANMEYTETDDNPCEVPACPMPLTLQMNFILRIALQPLMGLIVLFFMVIWNMKTRNAKLVAFGRKISCGKCCKVREKSKEMPLSLLAASHVPMVQLLLDGATRLKECTETSELNDHTFQEILEWEQFLTTTVQLAAVLTPSERAMICWRAAVAGMGAIHRQELQKIGKSPEDRKKELLDLVEKREDDQYVTRGKVLWIWSIHMHRALCGVFMFARGLRDRGFRGLT